MLNIRFENLISFKHLEENLLCFHASSIGEINAFYPLIKEALKLFKKLNLSVFTKTGYKHAKKIFENENINIFSFPILNAFTFLRKQKAIFIYENDFWPQMFFEAKRKNIPIFIFDLRVSDKHLEKYKKFKFFYKFIFKNTKKIFVPDRKKIEKLKSIFHDVDVFSYHPPLKLFKIFYFKDPNISKLQKLKSKIKDKIFLFASLHDSEAYLLKDILNFLLEKGYKIFISPRHVDNIENILKVLKNYNYLIPDKKKFFENIFKFLKASNIFLFPYFGVQKYLYPLADISLVGGSFNKKGGHDIVEPAYFKNVIFIGPSYENQIGNLEFVRNIYILNNIEEIKKYLEKFENLKPAQIKENINENLLRETLIKCLN